MRVVLPLALLGYSLSSSTDGPNIGNPAGTRNQKPGRKQRKAFMLEPADSPVGSDDDGLNNSFQDRSRVDDSGDSQISPRAAPWNRDLFDNSYSRGSTSYEDNDSMEVDPLLEALEFMEYWDPETESSGIKTIAHGDLKLKLLKMIDESSYGEVFLAEDDGRTKYAVKFVYFDYMTPDDSEWLELEEIEGPDDESGEDSDDDYNGIGVDDPKKEYDVLKDLGELNGVVKVFGPLGTLFWKRVTIYYMVLEYLEITFKDKAISAVNDPLWSRMELMAGFGYFATKMLQKIHSRGYVHCDIHARAFMEDSDKLYRIIDFGKARNATINDGELRSSIAHGRWVGADNPILLSVNELRDELCRPRDDLLRLGEILIEHWPTRHISPVKRERITMGLSILSPADQLKEIIDFKTTLSLASLFPSQILESPPKEFPPKTYPVEGSSELRTFVDEFYHKALSLGPDQRINYDEFLSLFIGDGGLLSESQAQQISDTYWPKN